MSRYDPFTYVLKDFTKTFLDRSMRNKPVDWISYLAFWLIPFVVTLAIFFLNLQLSGSLVNVLLVAFSVFAALLFNVLLLIYDLSNKLKSTNSNDIDPKVIKSLVIETFTRVSFSILISILSIIFLIISSFGVENIIVQSALKLIVFYLLTIFIMSLFIDLRRIYVLLQYEINLS